MVGHLHQLHDVAIARSVARLVRRERAGDVGFGRVDIPLRRGCPNLMSKSTFRLALHDFRPTLYVSFDDFLPVLYGGGKRWSY